MGQQISFRGTARERRNRGFNPIQVPDQTWKFQEETRKRVEEMRQAQRDQLEYRTQWLAQKKENDRKEEFVREKYFKQGEEWKEEYHKAEMQHYKQRLADWQEGGGHWLSKTLKAKHDAAAQKEWEKLFKLIPSAIESYAKWDKQHTEQQKAIGREVAIRWGLSPKEAKAIGLAEGSTGWADQAVNKLRARMEANGAKTEDINSLLNLSGRKLLGAQIYAVTNAARFNYAEYTNEIRNTETFGGQFTLNDHESGVSGTNATSFRALQRQRRIEWLKKLEGYDEKFLAKHVTPWLDKHDQQELIGQIGRDKVASNAAFLEKQVTSLKGYLFGDGAIDPGGGFLTWIKEESFDEPGRKGAIRRQGFDALASMAASGELTYEQWGQIRNREVMIGNSPQVIGHIWKDDAAIVEKALHERYKKDNQRYETHKKNFSLAMRQEVATMAMRTGRNLNRAEVDKLENHFIAQGYIVPEWLVNYKNQEEMSQEVSKEHLEDRVHQGTLSMAELYSGRYHQSHLKTYEQHTVDGPGSISPTAKAEFVGSIKSAVSSSISNLVPTDSRGAQVRQMSGIAVEMLNKRVKEATIAGIYNSPIEAWEKESSNLRKDIEAQKGFWDVNRDSLGNVLVGKEGGFKHLEKTYDYDQAGVEYRKAAIEDKRFIVTKGSVSKNHIEAIQGVAAGQPIPGFIFQLDQVYPSKDPYQIMNSILEANGEERIEPLGGARVRYYVRPEVEKLLTRHPSLSKTIRAMTYTTIKENPNIDPWEPSLQLLKSKEVLKVDPNGGYDVITTPRGTAHSKDVFNRSLQNTTVDNILKLGRRQGGNFGAFGFDTQTIQFYVDKGILDPTEPFDQKAQERIAQEEVFKAGNLETPSGQPIPGLGQDTTGWETKPRAAAEKEVIYKKLAALRFEPWKMKDGVV